MIDYALHRIRIEQLMKVSRQHLLKNEYHDAYENALHLMAETKLYANAIKDMIKENDGHR